VQPEVVIAPLQGIAVEAVILESALSTDLRRGRGECGSLDEKAVISP
jgi:hypothetical protein